MTDNVIEGDFGGANKTVHTMLKDGLDMFRNEDGDPIILIGKNLDGEDLLGFNHDTSTEEGAAMLLASLLRAQHAINCMLDHVQ